MSNSVISVHGLGKQYQRGGEEKSYRTIREAIVSTLQFPLQVAKSIWAKSTLVDLESPQDFWALRDVSFQIDRGDTVGIIGGNGAGKSTLLKIISRITEPTCGSVEVRGRVGSLLEVGTGFHPELSGRENVFLNGAILGMDQSDVRRDFDEIVAFAGVERFIDVPVKRYSSGMYMRLAFSVAAFLKPDLLLVDEVLAVGDVSFQKKCLARLKNITSDHERTVLFVSHDMQAIESLCSRVLHFERGCLVDSGPARAVIGRYLNAIGSAGNSRSWSGDELGNEEVVLRSIEVSSEHDAKGIYYYSSDLTVNIVFEAAVVREGLCVGFDILTPEGTTVFRSYQTDSYEDQSPVAVIGANSWQCTIPGGLLNEGEYFVSPRLSIHNQYWIVNEDPVIRFELTGRRPGSALFSRSSRLGMLNPPLAWETVA